MATNFLHPHTPSTLLRYAPPEWASKFLRNIPEHRLNLASLPTPLYRIQSTNDASNSGGDKSSSILDKLDALNITLLVKRDDMTAGVELGGNKIRKLEFLLADALKNNFNSVVTIGGEQSNHCRATAAACRMVGLEPHLILRTKRANQVEEKRKENNEEDAFGYTGNILFDRIIGAKIYTCTPGEYGRVGSKELVKRVCSDIESKMSRKAYPIPVGGSNGLGTWGYIEGVNEIIGQLNIQQQPINHVVFACGSGGTATGISLGFALSHAFKNTLETMPKIHAIGVCDTPEYFQNEVASVADEMGFDISSLKTASSSIIEAENTLEFIQKILTPHQGKGNGYAQSTKEELDFISNFAIETGIVLDPVYSGKALYHFIMHELNEHPNHYKDSTILFWHTGGSLGLYDKIDALSSMVKKTSPVTRLDVYGKK